MSTGPATISAEERPLLAAARAGDEDAFARLVEPYRGELHAHAYRMLGSVHDAEDALQEALLRAWRALARFEGRSTLRSWLYTITTNTSLNAISRRPKRVLPIAYAPAADPHGGPGLPVAESVWMEPYADDKFGLQDGLAGPEARYEQRESVELAFIAALQHLPANQRAVLILRDVLGFSAKETAETLETTVASANSALQRARTSVDERLPEQSQQATLRALGDERLNEIVDGYMKAWESCDVDAVVGMLTEDACFSMPPLATWFGPRPEIETFLVGSPMSGTWRWKSVRVRSNGQVALAFYAWDDDEGAYLPFALNVLTFRGELISDVTAFIITRPPEEDDREAILRMPERATNPLSLEAAFGNFGVPDRLH
jgi:RNA polymerase sigma-70 factor, ECF subfamily